jgi:hypothetical protein
MKSKVRVRFQAYTSQVKHQLKKMREEDGVDVGRKLSATYSQDLLTEARK